MKSSEIILRARSLADIPNSKYINNNDEQESLWESYKDVYTKLTDSSDDYFIKEFIVDTSIGVTKLGESEYEITIPDDVYKLRFVDYKHGGIWYNMEKFNTNQRNNIGGLPKYRWRGAKLWVTAGAVMGLPSEIRLDYYPSPIKPTVPTLSVDYCQSYATYDLNKITSKVYTEINGVDYLLYIYNGVNIYVESKVLNTKTLLYTGTGLSGLQYYAGYIYYISGGKIYKASTTMLATITPSAIVSSGTVTALSITGQKLYYNDAGSSYTATLAGGTITLFGAFTIFDVCTIGSYIAYRSATGFIVVNGVASTIQAVNIASDGVYLYYLDLAGDVIRVIDYGLTAQSFETIGYGINMSGGDVLQTSLVLTGASYEVSTLSTIPDTDFSYPVNEANELMAYQSAIDFKRKANGETSILQARYNDILARFLIQIKRDEYQTERRSPEYFSPYNF